MNGSLHEGVRPSRTVARTLRRTGITAALLVILFGGGRLAASSAPSLSTAVPILLVPGWFNTERDLAALRIRLVSSGWAADHVEAMTFSDPTGSNRTHAREIAAAVEALLDKTGAERVDIVAHSMGGLAVRAYLRDSGGRRVRRVVFVATPQRGTYAAYLAFGDGREEMIPGSAFLDSLSKGPPLPEGVGAITIRTPIDVIIIPGESARLPGYEDYEVCCPTHEGLLRDLKVFRLVRRFLSDGPLLTEAGGEAG